MFLVNFEEYIDLATRYRQALTLVLRKNLIRTEEWGSCLRLTVGAAVKAPRQHHWTRWRHAFKWPVLCWWKCHCWLIVSVPSPSGQCLSQSRQSQYLLTGTYRVFRKSSFRVSAFCDISCLLRVFLRPTKYSMGSSIKIAKLYQRFFNIIFTPFRYITSWKA